MQIEITLTAGEGAGYSARDLGYLLHKNPANVHARETSAGHVTLFFAEATDARATAVLHLDVDPVALVRGKSREAEGPLAHYVNDRPYVVNSLMSVALARTLGQSLAGTCRDRPDLASRPLPLAARVVPVSVAGGLAVLQAVFAPLGYEVAARDMGGGGVMDVHLQAEVRLSDLLNHLYVLVPVLDNARHHWLGAQDVDTLMAKGEGWLSGHPARDLITRRALAHRRHLVTDALARLAEADTPPETDGDERAPEKEETLEAPIRLHDLRLDTVVETLSTAGVRSVLDLGCGEAKLIRRLMKVRGIDRILGVDPSVRALEIAARRLKLEEAGEGVRERVGLQLGSLTYGDRRWHGFEAAALVEVIEHIDPPRLSALELALFQDARPRLIVVTTPNREYNALFDDLAEGRFRHGDHRFEWTRAEFERWGEGVASRSDYDVRFHPIGPVDDNRGAPSQMAVFTAGREGAA